MLCSYGISVMFYDVFYDVHMVYNFIFYDVFCGSCSIHVMFYNFFMMFTRYTCDVL